MKNLLQFTWVVLSGVLPVFKGEAISLAIIQGSCKQISEEITAEGVQLILTIVR